MRLYLSTLIMARELASLVNDKTDSEKVSRLINAQQYALGIRKLEVYLLIYLLQYTLHGLIFYIQFQNANATRLALSKHSNNRDVIPIPPDDDVMDLEQLEATVNKLEQVRITRTFMVCCANLQQTIGYIFASKCGLRF